MTTKEKLESILVKMGLSDSDAKQIVELSIPEIERLSPDGYKITWNRPASEYPPMIYGLWMIPMKKVALKWIKENCPNAWFRPIFDDKQMMQVKSEMRTVKQNEELMGQNVVQSAHLQIEKPETGEIYAVHVAFTRPKKKFNTQFSYHKGYAVVNGVNKKAKTGK